MTELRLLADGGRFVLLSGVHGMRISDRGIHGVRVQLDIVEGCPPVVKFLHGGVRVHLLPSLGSSCAPPTKRKRVFDYGPLDFAPHKLHTPRSRKTA